MTKSKKKDGSEECDAVTYMSSCTSEKPNLNGDWLNFFLLIILYVIQGFPVGLTLAISNILQSKKTVTYADQALLSTAMWPYWIKLLWAPIIDSFYIQWIGRRKSWLVPVQIMMGLLFLYMASNLDDWLSETGKPNLKLIALVFLTINFLSATQDIAVDGWSLTMLKKKNVSYASTCSMVGVIFGMYIGSVCFTLLVSEGFSNTYLRSTPGVGGLITIKNFLYVWGIFVLSTSILVGIFKKEKDSRKENGYVKIDVFQNYKLIWDILKLPRMKTLLFALLTMKIGFTTMDNNVSHLKFIDAGVSKDDIMIITTCVYILQLSVPFLLSKYTTSLKPMSYYLQITPIRLLWSIAYAVLIYYTPSLLHRSDVLHVPMYYYFIIGVVISVNEVMSILMHLSLFALFCRLSDPRFGGTYMTLFNTLYFLGFIVSNTFVLKSIDLLTFSKCSNDYINRCSTPQLKDLCKTNGGNCEVNVDGYYMVVIICIIIGFVWYGIFKKTLIYFQSFGLSAGSVKENQYCATETNVC